MKALNELTKNDRDRLMCQMLKLESDVVWICYQMPGWTGEGWTQS